MPLNRTFPHCISISTSSSNSLSETPNLLVFSPEVTYLKVWASMFGFTLMHTFAVKPYLRAISFIIYSSCTLSTFRAPMPAMPAFNISSSLLPTPANTIFSAAMPQLRARRSSSPLTQSTPKPYSPSRETMRAFSLALVA